MTKLDTVVNSVVTKTTTRLDQTWHDPSVFNKHKHTIFLSFSLSLYLFVKQKKATMSDIRSKFLEVYSVLKSELLNDPAFEFSHDSRQWVERVIFQFSLCFSLSLSHTHTYACVCAIFVYMYVCINGCFVICDWEFGLRLIGFQAIWCILFGLFVSLSFWVLRKKLHFFHLQEKKLDFCYFFSLSPCWTMDHSCRTWWDFFLLHCVYDW